MADVSVEILERNHLNGKDIAWLVPHQANLRIIDATAQRMGIDRSKVMINIDRYGQYDSRNDSTLLIGVVASRSIEARAEDCPCSIRCWLHVGCYA